MKKVAVINSNEDVVEAIQLALNTAGYETVGAHLVDFKRGRKDIFEFVRIEAPDAIVLDIAPPYEENWRYYELLKSSDKLGGISFILTTTNIALLKKAIDSKSADAAVEIMGKPFDIDAIRKKVRKALK